MMEDQENLDSQDNHEAPATSKTDSSNDSAKYSDSQDREEIYAKAVRAGKRTYFFDVRATRANDYYLTITESKRRYNDDGTYRYQKHKIFLYKEDFEKFSDALADSIKKIIELKKEQSEDLAETISNKFTDVNFDDLGTSNHIDKTPVEIDINEDGLSDIEEKKED